MKRDETFFTPEEIAQKLKLSKYTIYEMIKRGEISAHRIGRSLRVTATEFETFLQQSRKTDNTFDAMIEEKDDEKFAKILDVDADVSFSINTELEGAVRVSIKPEEIILSAESLVCSARNVLKGTVTGLEETPENYRVTLNVGVPLTVAITRRSVEEMNINIGDELYAVFKALSVVVV